MRDEQQLLAASAQYSIAHMRTALAAMDNQLTLAKARVIEFFTEEQRRKGEAAKVATWKAAAAFTGKKFSTESEVDAAFDTEKEKVKSLVREGKVVQVV